ncbi:MAG TPA: hypothetical protein VGO29_12340 [Solirubrobacteraceae bacterium]|jgi:hypothetical protein|nr:hypothetical protein [Solirubrobacteraceae bacterium]
MLTSRLTYKALLAACLLLIATAAVARAAAPASVTVRVEGSERTLLAPSTITTTAAPVVKDGKPADACTGTSAAGALEQATSGSWGGTYFNGLGYSAETILGETHKFEFGAPANFFWSFWLNNTPSSKGICEAELNPGDSVLFFPDCFSETGACPPAPNPLGIAAPTVVEAGSPFTLTVTSYANASGASSPAVGATVATAGTSTTTDSSGHATLALSEIGNVVVHASAASAVRSQATVCVHKANDGNCGTAVAAGTTTSGAAAGSPQIYKGAYAVVARASGALDGHVYPARRAPRLLGGTVSAHTSLASVSLRLRRSFHGRCFAFDAISARFVRNRCGQGSFFKVSTSSRFSYLLPAALARGRYVLDIEATDTAGNHTTLARGSSRIVFYVR